MASTSQFPARTSRQRVPAESTVYVVALTAFAGAFEPLVKQLAAHLKQSDAEIRARLSGTLPRLIRVCRNKDAVLSTLRFLRDAGQQATACDASAICGSEHMASLEDGRFVADGVAGTQPGGATSVLPYRDALCLLPAFHGRYLLYVFQRGSQRPWLLRESSKADFARPQRSPDRDFSRRVHELRRALTDAVYDERLLTLELETPTAVLRAGDATPVRNSRLSLAELESTVSRRSWSGSDEAPDGLIGPLDSREQAEATALDVMAHLTALCYSRGYF